MSQSGVLKRSTLLIHGSVAMPLAVIGYPLAIYLPPFYASELGLPLAMVGLMIFLARLSDVITDPLIGSISDRWESPLGRRKIWLLLGMPLMMIGIVNIFMPDPPVDVWHLLIWTAVMYLGWTMITLPYGAWGAELSPIYHQRSRVTAAREGYILVGLLLAAMVPAVVQHLGRRYEQGYTEGWLMESVIWLIGTDGELGTGNAPILAALAWLMLILLPLTILLVTTTIAEPRNISRDQIPWRKGLRILKNNGPLKRMLLVLLIVITGEAFRSSLSYFFMDHIVQISDYIGLMYLMYFGLGILAVPFWLALGRRIGKHRAFCMAMIVASIGSLGMLFLGPGDFVAFTILFAVKGTCFGAFQFLPLAMLADIVDVDTARSGEQRTGLIFALAGMTQKFSMAVGVGLSLGLLHLAQFEAGAANEEPQLLALKMYYVIAPVLFYMAAYMLAWRYPLTERRQARLRALINRRNAARGRPFTGAEI